MWTWTAADGGAANCSITSGLLASTSLDKQQLTGIQMGAGGSFTGSPSVLLDNRYGRLLTVVGDQTGLLWLTTSNKDGLGTPVPSDDRVIVVPSGSSRRRGRAGLSRRVGLVWSGRAPYAGVMATTVNVYEAKTRLSALLNLVEAGEEVIIARNGRPIARLGPLTNKVPNRVPGAWRGQIHIADDFDDFTEQDEADWYGPIEPRGMRILLDTHVLLWWLGNDRRLPDAIGTAMNDGTNEVLVSSISVAEISIKTSLGKLHAPDDLLAQLRCSFDDFVAVHH